MNTPTPGARRPNSALSLSTADRLDADARRLTAEVNDLLTLVVDRLERGQHDAATRNRLAFVARSLRVAKTT